MLLFSCIKGGEEPLSAVIMGGRHPGQYFLFGGESVDYLITNSVCNTLVDPEELQLAVSRAGAMTDLMESEVLLCGGRDTEGMRKLDLSSLAKPVIDPANLGAAPTDSNEPAEDANSTDGFDQDVRAGEAAWWSPLTGRRFSGLPG